MKEKKNVTLKDGYTQVCIWPGCVVQPDNTPKQFETFMLEQFNVRIQYLEEVKTAPDRDRRGNPVPGTGDRNDVLFAVHAGDIGHFAIPRLQVQIRWIEDVMSAINHSATLYPSRFYKYCTWGDAKEVADSLASVL